LTLAVTDTGVTKVRVGWVSHCPYMEYGVVGSLPRPDPVFDVGEGS